jgi:hypothetical protein
MAIGIHHDLKAARRLDPLTIHRLPDALTSAVPAWVTA